MKNKSLALNSIINLIRTILGVIFPLITFKYASKILGVTGIGRVDYANSVANYFVLLAGLGITTYAIREGAKVRDNKEKLNHLATEILLINVYSTVVAYILLFLITNLPAFKEYRSLLLVCGTTMLLNLIGVNWVFNIFEDYLYITVRTLIFQVISLFLLFLLVKTPDDYLRYAALLVFSSVGSNIYNVYYSKKFVHFLGDGPYNLKRHMKPILVIFGLGVASQIYLNMDTTMIGYMKGDYENGLYAAAVKINRTLGTLISSACAVLIPRLSYYIKNEMISEYKKVIYTAVNYIMVMTIPCALGYILLSSDLIILFSERTFIGAVPIMAVLGINIVFSVMNGFLAYQVFVPFGKEMYTLWATIAGAIVNAALNYILILYHGAMGAAVATVVAEGIVFMIQFSFMRRFYNDYTLYNEVWKYIVSGAVMFAVGLFINRFELPLFLHIMVMVPVCAIIYGVILWFMKSKVLMMAIAVAEKYVKSKR